MNEVKDIIYELLLIDSLLDPGRFSFDGKDFLCCWIKITFFILRRRLRKKERKKTITKILYV